MRATLEVDMPDGCYDCQFCAGTECGAVKGMPTIDLFGEDGIRPKWCPRAAMVRGTLASSKKRCKGCRSRRPLEGGKDKAQKHGIPGEAQK